MRCLWSPTAVIVTKLGLAAEAGRGFVKILARDTNVIDMNHGMFLLKGPGQSDGPLPGAVGWASEPLCRL